MTPVTRPVPSREACAGCDLLQIYGCPCQPPTCRGRTWPGSPECQGISADCAALAALAPDDPETDHA